MHTQTEDTEASSRIARRLTLSAPMAIVATVLWISIVANQTLWSEISVRLAPLSVSGFGYALSLLSLMVVLLSTPLLMIAQRWILKPLLIALLLLSGTLAYFTQELGVIFDVEMVRNVVETVRDRNTQEGAELISASMLGFLLLTMTLPIALILRSRINYGSLWRDQMRRVAWWLGLVCISGSLVLVNFKYVTYFSRENNDLEVYLTPFYTMKTTNKLVKRHYKTQNVVFNEIGKDAMQIKSNTQRTVGVMVVGETARRDHFSLNGYPRDTNPELSKRNIVNFSNVTSCGTSTAYSVPCMFSFMGQDEYTPESAGHQSNVLDVLETAGVKTIWVDSNSSCKGVCARIESINIMDDPDSTSPLFVGGAWHDEKLLEYLDLYLDSTDEDVLLVLHSMGSHGPAYYRRYPEEFARYQPYCKSKAPQDCTKEQIVNAYDNTIAYTDHVLAAIIDKLAARHDSSFMLYASDHGESLGENGVYLHGLPRFLAPEAQTQVPVIAWFSDQYINNEGLPSQPQQVRQVSDSVTHDNLSASLLGLYDVQTDLYQPTLDLFMNEGPVFDSKLFVQNTTGGELPSMQSLSVKPNQ
jgi:lipid A ethanolaminephosphotransferase